MDKHITQAVSHSPGNINRYQLLPALLAAVALLFFLIPSSYFVMDAGNFLPLHTLLEFSSVLVAFMVFGVTWHSLSPTRSINITMLGCAMMASGLLDLAHTLSYKGMPDFVTPSSPEKGIAFWLAARFTVAAALCALSFMPAASHLRPRYRYGLLLGFSLYALLIYWLVLFHQALLPRTFVEGEGLTGFKIACEWAVIGLFLVASNRFLRWTGSPDSPDLKTYFFTAAVVFILSEMFFTQYKSTSDVFNVLGHIYKTIGYLLLYRAVFVTTTEAPYVELERQQIRYRQLFDNMTSCGVVYQAADGGNDFIFLEVNQAAERTEKISRKAFIGRRVTELFPDAADFGLLDVLRRVWRTGQPEHFSANYYQDDRIASWRENYLYRLSDDNIVAIYEDITERKQAEQALQESEKNFRVIFETAAIGIAESDPATGIFLRVNSRFCQITGYSAEELLTMTFSMITHPDAKTKDREDWQRLVNGEIPEYETEKRYIRKDGHEIWVHLNVVALRDENGKVLRTFGAITDINARKQAESDRRRYDQELKSIFNALPDFYFRLDTGGIILSYRANPTTMGVLYPPLEQFVGKRLTDVLPPEQAGLFDTKLQELRNSGKVITFEYRLSTPSENQYYEARLTSLAYSDDIIVLIRDIAERKQLEQQLQQAQKMEALGQLTGGIAHDFNNILASVLGYSNLALERCVSDPSDKLARYLGEVISASERARDLIAKLLAYSRTSLVQESLPLDIGSEVEKAAAMLSVAIPAGIDVVIQLEPFLPPVRIDPIDIQQTLVNLAVNARDAIGEQGRIDIILKRTKIHRSTCVICGNSVDGEFVVLEVKDNGDGIPAEAQQRIFDPFFTTKEVGKGSGLGLSMVHGIVIKNNAHLLLESSFEQGTSFQLLFPFADTGTAGSATAVDNPIAPLTGPWRIWVVEDQESLASYYQELLQEQGYRVTVFTAPVDALHAFQTTPDSVDLILTDQTMPYLSGAELAEAVLAIRPELPIVLATGYSEKINADEAQRLGIRCFLNKPVDGKKLLSMLAAELGNTGA